MSNATGNEPPPAAWYPDRNVLGQDRWWNGAAWTEHTRTEQPAPAAPVQAQARAATSGACPHCGSTDTTTLRMIVANGTSHGTTRGTSTGWVDGSGGQPGHTATFTTTQRTTTLTAAAREASPPRKRRNGITLILIGIAIGGFGGWVGYALAADRIGFAVVNVGAPAIIGAVLVLWGTVLALLSEAPYNRDEYPNALARWSRSWQCQRCGAVFEL
ncbi:MAG: hypothetical protein JWM49_2020 [Microbacteriaceae bacterium]|nr:hypothetical protein [Microbacteriaceae bacterium]